MCHCRILTFFSRSHTNSDTMRDSPASKILKEMAENSAYPLNDVNTSVFNEKNNLF